MYLDDADNPVGKEEEGSLQGVEQGERDKSCPMFSSLHQCHRKCGHRQTLSQGCCFLGQQGHMLQKIQRRRGKERSSTSDTVCTKYIFIPKIPIT